MSFYLHFNSQKQLTYTPLQGFLKAFRVFHLRCPIVSSQNTFCSSRKYKHVYDLNKTKKIIVIVASHGEFCTKAPRAPSAELVGVGLFIYQSPDTEQWRKSIPTVHI